jgi:hypothetical protein
MVVAAKAAVAGAAVKRAAVVAAARKAAAEVDAKDKQTADGGRCYEKKIKHHELV